MECSHQIPPLRAQGTLPRNEEAEWFYEANKARPLDTTGLTHMNSQTQHAQELHRSQSARVPALGGELDMRPQP